MSATARYGCALFLGAAFFAGSAAPAFASDEQKDQRVPAIEQTLAAAIPVTPAMTAVAAVAPDALLDAAQRAPIQIALPPDNHGGLAAPSLRRSMYVSFGALQVLDAVSTRQALSAGGREANPPMAGLARNTAALFAVKAGTAAVTTFFAERLAKNHPRRATVLMAVLNSAYVAIVAHNYRVARAR